MSENLRLVIHQQKNFLSKFLICILGHTYLFHEFNQESTGKKIENRRGQDKIKLTQRSQLDHMTSVTKSSYRFPI